MSGLASAGAAVGVLFLAVWTLVLTAWVSDDAYISFRVVDNLVHGYGMRWNGGERVQTFSNPLWVLLMVPGYALTGDIYYPTLAISGLLALATLWVVMRRCSASPGAGLVGALVLVLSPTFIAFSTSGLETTLSHLFAACFCARYVKDEASPERQVRWLTLIASLAAVNRLDNALLLGIPLAAFALRHRSTRVFGAALTGALPLIAWEVFSLVYYGMLVPNTAFAKLNTGIPTLEIVAQGWRYLRVSAQFDPIGTGVLVVALAVTPFLGRVSSIGIGIAAQIVYTVWVGGDFMTGRFLSVPGVAAAAVIAHVLGGLGATARRNATVAICLGLAVATPFTARRTFVSSRWFTPSNFQFPAHGVIDERAFYFWATGLVSPMRAEPMMHPWGSTGVDARLAGTRVVRGEVMGFAGFFAGPGVHFFDIYALCDPLLARLPARRPWRIGHFERDVPQGYEETLETGVNVIADPDIARLYDLLARVTRGPLFTAERWRAIASLNFGEARRLARDSRQAARTVCRNSNGRDEEACRRAAEQ